MAGTEGCRNYDRVPDIASKVQQMDRELGEIKSSATSAHKRLDNVQIKVDAVFILVEATSDAILGHMKKEEGMYVVLGWILSIIAISVISMFAWIYNAHVNSQVMMARQQVMIETNHSTINNNHKMISELVKHSKIEHSITLIPKKDR